MNPEPQSVLTKRKTFYHHAATSGIVIPLVGLFWGLFYEGYRLDHLPQSHLWAIIDAVFQETIPIMCFLGFASSIVALFGIRRYGSEGILGKVSVGLVIFILMALISIPRLCRLPDFLVEIAWQPPVKLAQQIADTDQVIILHEGNNPISMTGENAKKIVNAASSARRDVGTYACSFGSQIEFRKGTNSLATVHWCGQLILADEGQFNDYTGVLNRLYHKLFME